MVKRRIFPWALVLFPLVCLQSQQRADNTEEAARIWEQMIDAKGGRTQLYQVETMVQETHQHLSFGNPKFQDGDNHIVRAFAFPDHIWDWSIAPVFGGGIRTADLSAGFGYIGYPNNDIRKTSYLGREKEFLEQAQLVYLNETRWMKPKPVGVLRGKEIPAHIEAIETTVEGQRVDFWIDREDHLPVKIIQYWEFEFGAGLKPSYTWNLSDYQQINGIQIPYQVAMIVLSGRPSTYRFTTVLNPKLRTDLFTSPPRFEDGPEAWKDK
jgi:hypothetical protein